MTVIKKYDGIAWQEVVVGESGQWNAAQTIRAETASTVLTSADAGRVIAMNSSSATAITVNGSTSFSPGQRVDFLRQGTGDVAIYGSGVTINGTPGLKLRARYSGASLLCIRPNVYVLTGDLDEFTFTPLYFSPDLWLDASDATTITEAGGAVSQWDDKSGNARNFTQAVGASQPSTGTRTLNGLNVLDFNGTSHFLSGGTILPIGSGDVTMIGVAKLDATKAVVGIWGPSRLASASGRHNLAFLNNTTFFFQFNDTTFRNASHAPGVDDRTETTVWGSRIIRNDTNTLWRNGSVVNTNSSLSGTTSYTPENVWQVGVYNDSTGIAPSAGSYMDGFVGELLVFMRSLSDTEMGQVHDYLNTKWSVY